MHAVGEAVRFANPKHSRGGLRYGYLMKRLGALQKASV